MSKILVYAFELYDPVRRAWRRGDFMATALAVERMGGVVIHSSATSVDVAQVRPDGRLEREPQREE